MYVFILSDSIFLTFKMIKLVNMIIMVVKNSLKYRIEFEYLMMNEMIIKETC